MDLPIGKDPARKGKGKADEVYLMTGEWGRQVRVWKRSELLMEDATEDELLTYYEPGESTFTGHDLTGYQEIGAPLYLMRQEELMRLPLQLSRSGAQNQLRGSFTVTIMVDLRFPFVTITTPLQC